MPMAGRSPARFLAPIALIAVVFALYSVVHNPNAADPDKGGAKTGQPTATATKTAAKKSAKKKRKMYTVKSGDTPSGIAAKAGISLEELEQLNPNLDPQSLAPGQRLRLSK
jgi:LysM repeat protein